MKKSAIIISILICLVANVYSYPAEDVLLRQGYEGQVSIITGNEYFAAVKSLIANAQNSIYMTMRDTHADTRR